MYSIWLRVFTTLQFIGVQYQQYWAYANNVNLLAAGGNTPYEGYSGSGIYSGHHGALNVTVSSEPVTKLLVARVPYEPQRVSSDTIAAMLRAPKQGSSLSIQPSEIFSKENLPKLQIQMLNFTKTSGREIGVICHNSFCCYYDIETKHHKLPENKVILCFDNEKFNSIHQSHLFLEFLFICYRCI